MSDRKTDDQLKLAFDLFKHLTTLNTGSLLLLLTFLEKFFKEPEWRFLIGASVILFLASIIASLFAMYLLMGLSHDEDGFELAGDIGWPLYAVALFGFVFGLGGVGVFAMKNFY